MEKLKKSVKIEYHAVWSGKVFTAEVFSWKVAQWECGFGDSGAGRMKILGNNDSPSYIKQEAWYDGFLCSNPDTVTCCVTLGTLLNFSVPQVDHASAKMG